ncbi:MAG: hypothetical protein HY461_00420 [Parcubacteria group bacterium]|nr:hypothetical protein [Parcubacteria group bacterium]
MKNIGIRQVYRDLKTIAEQAQRGESFLVFKNAKPLFRIEPPQPLSQKPFTLKDLKKIHFKSGDPDLSQKIDQILYGAA